MQRLGGDGNARGADDAEDIADLPPGKDARAFVIVIGQDAAPTGLAECRHRKSDIQHEEPRTEISRRNAFLRQEDKAGADEQDRQTEQHPELETADPGARAIHPVAERRIDKDVERPNDHENDPDDGADLQLRGVEFRQGDRHGQTQGRKGNAWPDKGQYSPGRYACIRAFSRIRSGHCAFPHAASKRLF